VGRGGIETAEAISLAARGAWPVGAASQLCLFSGLHLRPASDVQRTVKITGLAVPSKLPLLSKARSVIR